MVNVSMHMLCTPVFPSAEGNRKHAQEKNSCVPAQLLCCTKADGCPREMLLEEVLPNIYSIKLHIKNADQAANAPTNGRGRHGAAWKRGSC